MRMSYEFVLVRADSRSLVRSYVPCEGRAHSSHHEERAAIVSAVVEPVWPGRPRPLGATWDGEGTNFAVFSEEAEAVELCLFADDGSEGRLGLPEVTAHTWHGYVPGVGPDQRYGFRVHGPFDPRRGLRFNPAKLLLDPYAR